MISGALPGQDLLRARFQASLMGLEGLPSCWAKQFLAPRDSALRCPRYTEFLHAARGHIKIIIMIDATRWCRY